MSRSYWSPSRYLFLHESSFAALQDYENRRQILPLPLDAFPRIFPKLVFIILVGDPDLWGEDDYEKEMSVAYRIHVYGEITPMDLVVASSTRKRLPPRWSRPTVWQEFLDNWDGEEMPEPEIWISWSHHIYSMTLHKNARFVTNDLHSLESLQHKESDTEPFEWAFILPNINSYKNTPKLDVSHLTKDTVGIQETLQGCVWLLQTNSLSIDHALGAAVTCRAEMILPLLYTVCFSVICCYSA
jgi:hypothetical protein